MAKTNDILFLHCFDGDFLDDEPAPVLEPQYGDHTLGLPDQGNASDYLSVRYRVSESVGSWDPGSEAQNI